jgi:hypothetical protein
MFTYSPRGLHVLCECRCSHMLARCHISGSQTADDIIITSPSSFSGAVVFKSVCNPERIDERSAIVNAVPSLRSTRIKKWRRLYKIKQRNQTRTPTPSWIRIQSSICWWRCKCKREQSRLPSLSCVYVQTQNWAPIDKTYRFLPRDVVCL